VVIAAPAPGYGAQNIVPVVNNSMEKFDQLGIPALVKEAGPYLIFDEDHEGRDVTVFVALPVAEPPASLPAPAQYLELPEVEVASTVRCGPAAGIFPMVYHDLARWIEVHGYHWQAPSREILIHERDDTSEIDQQVLEIQLPFTRPDPRAA
jgi:effector-binding domain-containing protein